MDIFNNSYIWIFVRPELSIHKFDINQSESKILLAVLIHVGQTRNVCGGKSPIYHNGTFKFVPIIVDPPRSDPDPTFEQLGLGDFVRPMFRDEPAFQSPEFKTLTYSHIARGGEGDIYDRLRRERGYLVFFTTLYYHDKRAPSIKGISVSHGAYIIGYFKIEGVYSDREVIENYKLQARFRANGQFGRKKENGERMRADWWISGSTGELLRVAAPLTEDSDPCQWNDFAKNNLTTTKGIPLKNYHKAFYNWTLVCPSRNLDSLKNWIYRFSELEI